MDNHHAEPALVQALAARAAARAAEGRHGAAMLGAVVEQLPGIAERVAAAVTSAVLYRETKAWPPGATMHPDHWQRVHAPLASLAALAAVAASVGASVRGAVSGSLKGACEALRRGDAGALSPTIAAAEVAARRAWCEDGSAEVDNAIERFSLVSLL